MMMFRTVHDDHEQLFEVKRLFDAYDGRMLGYYVEFLVAGELFFRRGVLKDPESEGTMVFGSPDEARSFAPQLIIEQLSSD
ncbi:hypothetical protein [Stratiformator vulcanicus]|nr:hypothetical protein [Stratiformator vulcanicus]